MSEYPVGNSIIRIEQNEFDNDILITFESIANSNVFQDFIWTPLTPMKLKGLYFINNSSLIAASFKVNSLQLYNMQSGNSHLIWYYQITSSTSEKDWVSYQDFDLYIPAGTKYQFQLANSDAGQGHMQSNILLEKVNENSILAVDKPQNIPCDVWNWLLGRCKT